MGILNIVTYTPLLGAAVILFFIRSDNPKMIRYAATIFATVDFIVSLFLWWGFDPNASGGRPFHLRLRTGWVPSPGAPYALGNHRIALLLIVPTTFIGLIAVLSSF